MTSCSPTWRAKKALYARHGVVEEWILDPELETVAVYRLAGAVERPARVLSRTASLGTDLLPGLAIDLFDLFDAI